VGTVLLNSAEVDERKTQNNAIVLQVHIVSLRAAGMAAQFVLDLGTSVDIIVASTTLESVNTMNDVPSEPLSKDFLDSSRIRFSKQLQLLRAQSRDVRSPGPVEDFRTPRVWYRLRGIARKPYLPCKPLPGHFRVQTSLRCPFRASS
jgi:hypothetical protein